MKADLSSRDLSLLVPDFQEKVHLLLANCQEKGFTLKPFFTVRGPAAQAKLWCQSRKRPQIERQVKALQYAGLTYLPSLFKLEWAGTGPKVTNALPGLSWHQWGEAVDCFVEGPDGQAIWNARHPGYKLYAQEAQALGLEAGGFWKRFPDAVHVQLRSAGSPLQTGLTWKDIDREMRDRFGIKLKGQ